MQTRLVLWGENSKEEKILIALDLLEAENQVKMWTFPHSEVSEDFFQLMMNEWRFGKEVSFPESSQEKVLEINLAEDLLPVDIKVSNTDLVQRAKAEWQFVIASNKMFSTYDAEVDDLNDKANSLDSFSPSLWDEMKAYWNKVQKQIYDKNLYGSHADTLRKKTDAVFDKLKDLRKLRDKAFREESSKRSEEFFKTLDEVEERIKKGLGLRPIFEELKKIQRNFNKTDMVRDHKNKVYKRIDALFKKVKKELFGEKSTDSTPVNKMQRRYDGLMKAIKKMKNSIKRDEDDLYYEGKRKDRSQGQLEDQLREAKLAMIQERLNSKRNKLEDMHKTRTKIESRLKKLLKKEEEKAKKEELKKAKEAAAAQIDKSIEQQKKNIDNEKIKHAVATIKGEAKAKGTSQTPPEKLATNRIKNVSAIAALNSEEE